MATLWRKPGFAILIAPIVDVMIRGIKRRTAIDLRTYVRTAHDTYVHNYYNMIASGDGQAGIFRAAVQIWIAVQI